LLLSITSTNGELSGVITSMTWNDLELLKYEVLVIFSHAYFNSKLHRNY